MSDSDYNSFLTIKILSIGYYSMIYFFFGFSISLLLNYLMPAFDSNDKEDEQKFYKIIKIVVEILFNFALIGISFYFVRKLVKNYIPFPLDTLYGFDKNKLKEIQGGIIIATIYMSFQTKLVQKLNYIKKIIGI
jgi:hypothetical protein